MNKDEKYKLWSDKIQEYQSSGKSCKAWCLEHQISLSTMTYWIRKFRKDCERSQSEQEPVFAKLPSEQELSETSDVTDQTPIRIYISDSIRMDILPSCPPELLHVIVGSLKDHA